MHENFFALGGNSIHFVTVLAKARKSGLDFTFQQGAITPMSNGTPTTTVPFAKLGSLLNPEVTTLAGTPPYGVADGSGSSAGFNFPSGIATDSARVGRSARWARWIASPCRRLFSARPMPELTIPP